MGNNMKKIIIFSLAILAPSVALSQRDHGGIYIAEPGTPITFDQPDTAPPKITLPLEPYEISNPLVRRAILATAAMIPRDKLLETRAGGIIVAISRSKTLPTCPLLEYHQSNHKKPAKCGGFLVGDDLLATAGHCLKPDPEEACASHAWIFDYAKTSPTDGQAYLVDADDVYDCREVAYIAYDQAELGRDFALVRLDRPVEDRTPLEMRKEGEVPDDSRLVAIGFPEGLPAKVSPTGTVLDDEEKSEFAFFTDLTTFQGNSGGPVLDIDTGLIEGIAFRSTLRIGTIDVINMCLSPTRSAKTIVNRATNLLSFPMLGELP